MAQKAVRIVALAAVAALAMQTVQGAPLTPEDLLLVLLGPVPDADLGVLMRSFGFDGTSTLDIGFSGASDLSTWAMTLSGQYLGTPLDVQYMGQLTSGIATANAVWSSAGLFGSATWSGSGSATVTGNPTGFNVAFHSMLDVGPHTGIVSADITSAIEGTTTRFVASSGTVTDDGGSPAFIEFTGVKFFIIIPIWATDLHTPCGDLPLCSGDDQHTCKPTPAGMECTGTFTTIPEPSTLALFGGGACSLLVFSLHRSRRRRSVVPGRPR